MLYIIYLCNSHYKSISKPILYLIDLQNVFYQFVKTETAIYKNITLIKKIFLLSAV